MENIRTLQMSREMWIFVGVTTAMSAIYLYQTTSEAATARHHQEGTKKDVSPGEQISVAITLITADVLGLACATDQTLGEAHCGFIKEGEAWKPKPGETAKPGEVMMPFMTVDNVLFLIPGLWEEPTVKKRLADDPPTKFSREELESRRFNLSCKLKIEQKMTNFKVRWQPTSGWGDRDSAWVGRVSDCKITG